MTLMRPVEIIGGGLAGLSLGLGLVRSGVPVSLLEAAAYPRHRVCGEFITGLSATTRARLGLDPLLAGAASNRTVAWFMRDTPVRYQTLPQIAPGLSRFSLDARLADAFVEGGGELQTNVRSSHVADAPGRVFATGRRRQTRSSWIGLKVHAVNLPLERDLELHLGEHAYAGLTRIESGRVNICGLFRRREISAKGTALLPAYLQACGLPELAVRLQQAKLDAKSCSAVAAVDFDPRVGPSKEMRLGDMLAMIPPFTGHGMAMAFQSAETALDPLIGYARGELTWDQTREIVQRKLRRRFQVRLASAGMLHSFFHQPAHQRWLRALNRARLLPLRPLYAALH
jgi:flavin-dependent dehydrogenase